MIRTQEEIKERFDNADDMFGVQRNDLAIFMEWDTLKEYVSDEYIEEVEQHDIKHPSNTLPMNEIILDYLPFAYSKADNQRGLSAGRSMVHFKTWLWLDDADFYNEIEHDLDNYTNYGIDELDKIASKYGYEHKN